MRPGLVIVDLHGDLPCWGVVSWFSFVVGGAEVVSFLADVLKEAVSPECGVVGLELECLHRKYNRFSS